MSKGLRSSRWSEIAGSYLWTSLFCSAIAVLLTFVGMTETFRETLVISFCIGLSINTAFVLLSDRLRAWESWYLGPIIITTLGLAFGLTIAGIAVLGEPWFFFSSNYSSLTAGIFFGVVGFLMFSTREQLLQARAQLAEAEAARAAQERRNLETELRLLQAQIEPHFLFNTLGNISSLIRNNPDGAEATLQNLSRLLRASLKRTRGETTTLGEELDVVSAYLEIQKVRMGERLETAVIVPEYLKSLTLPPLLLQPLVENAVMHGIDPKIEGGRIGVDAAMEGEQVVIRVVDTGQGFGSGTQGSGVGLRNVRERLSGLYGNKATLDLIENPGGGITAELRLPAVAA